MFSRIKSFLTTYNTNQISEITNRPIHCFIYRFIQLCITAYIILLIVEGKLYLKTDPPIPGAVRLTLQEPNNFTKPSYCVESSPTTNPPSCAEDKLPCVYWGAKEIQYPIEETGVAFFTTRASIVKYPQGTCKILASSPEDACIINSRKSSGESVMNSSFIADIENYTVMIEHSIASIDGKILLKNRLMDGQFLSADDTTVIKSWWANSNEADGDILTMKEILDAAGADLSACSSAPGANKDVNESNRSSGIIIVIVIHYEYYQNPRPISLFVNNVYNYKYKPRIIDDAEYKIIEATSNIDDGSYIIKNRHGIRLVFHQHGKIRSFSWTDLIINITASLYSYRVVSLIMDFSIRHEVDTWFRGIFRSNRNNDIENNEDNEETLPLIRYEDENENEQI
ncbi:uncharacterized protein OCT59_017800 [Rhizophagus irregularis]|uniref:Uncharacterized protein n=2 Tax=Rhizophagus irregularis TaxID=588596 RepID=A0A015IZ87_RHIIW|nr:hypothetical protein GLOIN_2v1663264 [Rhizophagus irregularis DAOM 181602=DAOM 197198]EXX62587.1 hypothetical protein RirG_160440 [Rhizophagus irregularis DAOM 197198w]UZO25535.1 hypothetical protein OCT59_017800 [Rhizophagus irregularis]POG65796.1 hypothetical protein GLOIN_2v1663264 [Rhizophagus irregularis DAOM 181602=DAOM 197198]CAG8521065.1 9778_t:CDS:2 [Rhizophagus irregularis]GBC46758.1 P2X receptor [Rhizophagus irregularis DAOM 181602=DAOM 197198]|eukprot:XP_025172662.1 hypothetical protein GLOIN_2v1663264 [Rhizophagus irregularis DAOM 181602=DAOM 197198]